MSLSRSGRSGQNSSAVLGFRHGVNAAESRPIEGTYSKCMGQLDPIWGMEYRLISRTCLHNLSSVQTSSGGERTGENCLQVRVIFLNLLLTTISMSDFSRQVINLVQSLGTSQKRAAPDQVCVYCFAVFGSQLILKT